MRLTKKVFTDLAIRMIGFGVLIGIAFPFFTLLMGVSAQIALTGIFFISCILAGVTVGFVNILLTRFTVGKRLKTMTGRMMLVEAHIMAISDGDDNKDVHLRTVISKSIPRMSLATAPRPSTSSLRHSPIPCRHNQP